MPRTPGRPRDPQLDVRILQAARALLEEGGLPALSVASVSVRAEVGRPSIYRRYTGTEDLAKAVLFADLDEVVGDIRRARDPDASPEDQLVAIATEIFRYYARNPGVSAGTLQMVMGGTGPWSDLLNEQLQQFLAWIGACMAECQARGTLRADADCALITQAFFAFYITLAIAGLRAGLPVEVQAGMLRAVLRQHLVGLVSPG